MLTQMNQQGKATGLLSITIWLACTQAVTEGTHLGSRNQHRQPHLAKGEGVHCREGRGRQGPPSLVTHIHQLLLQAHVLTCQPPHQLVQLAVLLLQLLAPLLYLVHLHALALPALVSAFPVALHACLHTTSQTLSASFLSGVAVPCAKYEAQLRLQ